jgi:hypothetical protein
VQYNLPYKDMAAPLVGGSKAAALLKQQLNRSSNQTQQQLFSNCSSNGVMDRLWKLGGRSRQYITHTRLHRQ